MLTRDYRIVVGAVYGQFDVFEKLSKLHQRNTFSLALIIGDLFANPKASADQSPDDLTSLLNNEITVSFPTYFALGKCPFPPSVQAKLEDNDDELCSNLYFLGKRSVTKTSDGLRIVAIGGELSVERSGLSKDRYDPFHTEADSKSLQGAHNADILISSCSWPSAIRSRSKVASPDGNCDPCSETGVADLCSALKPRYHLSTSDHLFFEREPFVHASDDATDEAPRITRFISLASYGNQLKQKWMYAFSIDIRSSSNTALPAGVTASPLMRNPTKRQRSDAQEDGRYRFSHDNSHTLGQRHPKRSKTQGPPGPESCFFCLSNPNLATHLITSIANDSYLTTAKGPLPMAGTFPSLAFPGHTLIIPLSHSSTFARIDPSETRVSTFEEMTRYRWALQSLVASLSEGTLGAVTWEISRGDGVHVHWQFLPVPAESVTAGLVEAAFKVEAENERYEPFEAKDLGDAAQVVGDFLRIWIWRPHLGIAASASDNADKGANVEEEKSLLLEIRDGSRFDLQFPRRCMAKLLGLEERFHWRDCSQTEAEEIAEAEAFKTAFKPFDFS